MFQYVGSFRLPLTLLILSAASLQAQWKPRQAPLMTRWAKQVSSDNAHPEYPRPQLVREAWVNLNGLWQYAIASGNAPRPDAWDGEILVPFPIESALSGVMQRVPDDARLWYRRVFTAPELPKAGRLLLHFGACDWETVVWVNGRQVGEHRGGYDPFTFDITEALGHAGEQELVVAVSDPTDGSFQPRGKQIRRPHGIWYTPTTGIWQTVWLESVSKTYVRSIRIETNLDKHEVTIQADVVNPRADLELFAEARVQTKQASAGAAATGDGRSVKLNVEPSIPWTPDSPVLYDLKLSLRNPRSGELLDEIGSYFAMRKISLGEDEHGVRRLLLNGKPLFQFGPLDQGFWPDGLYTAPTDEALRYDIELTKKLGFNMIRKHVKVEPDRWYHWCDRLGVLVWQDMPSGDRYIGGNDPDIERSAESTANFQNEWREIIADFGNHPCIVMWVPFNEGWGQFDTAGIVEYTRKLDPSRLVNSASGWTDRHVGDVHDIHVYPGPGMAPLSASRASVLGEYGGLGLPIEGHTWQAKDNWGYRSFTNQADLQKAYLGLTSSLRPLIGQGLAAAVYTQTTDVEIEVNGLMTYDRQVLKFDADTLARAHRRLYLPPPKVTTIVPTSQLASQTWRYTTEPPRDEWHQPEFDDSSWKSGPGGFGEPSTPGSVVKTNWKTNDIWLRREFELPSNTLHEVALRMHHDEDAEVYLNGELIAKATGYTTQYVELPLEPSAVRWLKPGRNTLAVHCKQTGGGQYIDVGLVDLEE